MGQIHRSVFVRTAATLGALALAGLLVWTAFDLSPRHGLDFSVYLSGGQSVIDAAGELYTKSVQYDADSSLLFTYPPFAALVFAVLAPFGQSLGLNIFTGISIAIAAATAVWAVRYVFRRQGAMDVLRHPWLRPLAIAGTGLIVLLGPWRETQAFGQINILLFGLIMADFVIKKEGWPTGLLTGVAAGLKLTPLVFGLYFLARGDWRGLRNMTYGFLSTFALGFLILPRESRTYWLDLLPDTSRIGGAGYVDNLSIKGAILHFGGPDFPVDLPWLVLSLLAVAATAVIIRIAGNRGQTFTALAATALLMLLISPVSWSHHWVWVALFIPVLARNVMDLGPERQKLRITGLILLASSLVIFIYSPKTIGELFNAPNLDSQLPEPWLMASSAGVFWGIGLLAWWFLAYWGSRPRNWWRNNPPGLLRATEPQP
ncbi:glycosyltransferase 87 family protein [Arthrobacter sp. zg-Y769]|uniref:glycosyltransferase 87 family protein n=1 Tax=Arthrobacter sp. zg-Y769 TaxID=2894191 RepID=UPI001E3A049E|nr:glycosyltransferase 87 family protein [Arthrobacter sp. zg-Y769]MCC9203860.1 glycosyltransferase 87 family protein [Arthrobacter sp. zg-Y769]